MRKVDLVDGVMHNEMRESMSVIEVNKLLYGGGAVIALRLRLKLGVGKRAEVKKPW